VALAPAACARWPAGEKLGWPALFTLLVLLFS
jgi:hypothetical protein